MNPSHPYRPDAFGPNAFGSDAFRAEDPRPHLESAPNGLEATPNEGALDRGRLTGGRSNPAVVRTLLSPWLLICLSIMVEAVAIYLLGHAFSAW